VSIAAALPINQMTSDQALDELVRLTDLRPPDEDVLGVIHWQQENSHRAQQLEAHILHLAKTSGAGALPGPEPEPQDAPPHHLQPESTPDPAATPRYAMHPPLKKTPQQKLDHMLDRFATIAAKVQANPGDRDARDDFSTIRSNIKSLVKGTGLPMPKLADLPPLPNPVRKGPAAKNAPALRALPKVQIEKAGPGPYKELTPEDLRALLPDQPVIHISESHVAGDSQELAEAIRRVVQAGNQNRAALDRHVSTADLDQRDRTLHRRAAPEMFAAPSDALESLRRIRRDTWLLLAQLADLEPQEREPFRPGLSAIAAGMTQGLVLLDEPPVSVAG
jgi:hypothetical protein